MNHPSRDAVARRLQGLSAGISGFLTWVPSPGVTLVFGPGSVPDIVFLNLYGIWAIALVLASASLLANALRKLGPSAASGMLVSCATILVARFIGFYGLLSWAIYSESKGGLIVPLSVLWLLSILVALPVLLARRGHTATSHYLLFAGFWILPVLGWVALLWVYGGLPERAAPDLWLDF